MDEKLFFYIFAGVTLLAATGVVLSKHLVRSLLWLVLAFITTATLWLLLKAELLAFLLALVYVGAVLVLFIFVIMLFDLDFHSKNKRFGWFSISSSIIAAILTAVLIYTIALNGFDLHYVSLALKPIKSNELLMLSKLLFTKYLFQVEMAGILLLTAIVATIGLTVKGTK